MEAGIRGGLESGPAEDAADAVPHFTVTVTLVFLPFAVFTVIAVVPFFTPLTSPLLFSFAMCFSELVQV